MLILIILYIILGLIIGTAIISIQNKKFLYHLNGIYPNDRTSYDPMDLLFLIIIYYILWPLPLLKLIWINFWKYTYKLFQFIIKQIFNYWELILYYFTNNFKNDILNILKDKK